MKKIMKMKLFTLALAVFVGVQAQENNPKDKTVETVVRTIKVKDNGKTVEKKIMVKTIETQEVKTNPEAKGKIDADRVFPVKKIEKVIYIDNDSDPFYDDKSSIVFYEKDGVRYDFNITNSGFDYKNTDSKKVEGRARFSNNANVYIIDNDAYSGIGYFKDGAFIVEFYDEDGTLVVERFSKYSK